MTTENEKTLSEIYPPGRYVLSWDVVDAVEVRRASHNVMINDECQFRMCDENWAFESWSHWIDIKHCFDNCDNSSFVRVELPISQATEAPSECPDFKHDNKLMLPQASPLVETISWIDASVELPDDGMDVLIVCPSPTYPVWIGHIDGDNGWCDSDGTQIAYRVVWWAELPEGPK